MGRRRLLPAAVALAVIAGAVIAWPRLPRPGVTRANYERIRGGMTRAEVEGIFGGPGEPSSSDQADGNRLWRGPGLAVLVWFDEQGRVIDKVAREAAEDGPEPSGGGAPAP
jgi:hypothetical protein